MQGGSIDQVLVQGTPTLGRPQAVLLHFDSWFVQNAVRSPAPETPALRVAEPGLGRVGTCMRPPMRPGWRPTGLRPFVGAFLVYPAL